LNLKRLVLDTGVLFAAFDVGDVKYHDTATAGFKILNETNTRLIAPSCVVLEVAKRLLFDVNATAMQTATAAMLETLDIPDTTPYTIRDALELIKSMKIWGATIEDAIVINTALALNAPVWTFNYRDFGTVKNLEFWTP
jgi:predicted nucleic acid-binding protein